MFLLMASARGAFSASTKLCASDVTSIPDPLPSLLIIPALALAAVALAAVLEEVLDELLLELTLVLVVEDDVEEDTEVTIDLG
jgi:hypothetical protein